MPRSLPPCGTDEIRGGARRITADADPKGGELVGVLFPSEDGGVITDEAGEELLELCDF
jgi:hypothetical protein